MSLGHTKGDSKNLYISKRDRRDLDVILKLRGIKASALLSEKIAEEMAKFNPKERKQRLEEQKQQIEEELKVCAECAHTQDARFDELRALVSAFKDYRKRRPTERQVADWLNGRARRDDVETFFGSRPLEEVARLLDELSVMPEPTTERIEILIGRQ